MTPTNLDALSDAELLISRANYIIGRRDRERGGWLKAIIRDAEAQMAEWSPSKRAYAARVIGDLALKEAARRG